ncbi:TlpA disulfide reductase family protein [Shewanella sp. Scap07]|uniref:TlpA family protein disulfide reductase n=1 Tax=Shewanella sp. Scap07 TaxID=2589987 RepID=UPI0015BA6EE1|nr:TlpA disulfide reductase family protein [Shewanella sp. Scap07]
MRKLSLTLSAIMLVCVSSLANASMPSDKVYATGESLPKPMIMSRFIEMQYARSMAEIELTTLTGQTINLQQHKGKLVLINLWATWCGPCIKEIPMMEEIRQTNKDNDLVVIPVSIDESAADIMPFLQQHGLADYQTYHREQYSLDNVLPANVVPATFVLDGDGNLIGFLRGYLDWGDKEVQPYLEALTAKYAQREEFLQ